MSLGRLSVLLVLAVPGVAQAQFVTQGDQLDQPARQNIEDTEYNGRLSLSTAFYAESGAEENGDGASPDALLWGDLRGRIEANHLSGSKFDALGDFRLRLGKSRGWIGENEFDLREAYLRWNLDAKKSVSLGRLILRDLDALTVDGASFHLKTSESFEFGAAGGLFPNPFSRSLDTDYSTAADDTRGLGGLPVGGGAWIGYRTAAVYGSLGVGAISPRSSVELLDGEVEPTRTFVTARGYSRLTPLLSLFHYGVFDITGYGGANLANAQVGLSWHATPRLTLDLAYSHMSTIAIVSYLREYLEPPDDIPQNNLDIARMAADEVRSGFNYNFLDAKIDLFGQVRLRRRDMISTEGLAVEIDDLPANNELDVSAGVRKKDAIGKWDLAANGAYLISRRSSSQYLFVRGSNSFLDDRLDVDLDAGVVLFQDRCIIANPPPDPTCTGTSDGNTIRAGGMVTFIRGDGWLGFVDYHLGYSTATYDDGDMMDLSRPAILSHSAFLRGQYSF
jgi:hypothetical protein